MAPSHSTRIKLTFATAAKLHFNLLVHILGQIKDILLLGPLLLLLVWLSCTATCTATALTAPGITSAAATTTTSSSERASFGHVKDRSQKSWLFDNKGMRNQIKLPKRESKEELL